MLGILIFIAGLGLVVQALVGLTFLISRIRGKGGGGEVPRRAHSLKAKRQNLPERWRETGTDCAIWLQVFPWRHARILPES